MLHTSTVPLLAAAAAAAPRRQLRWYLGFPERFEDLLLGGNTRRLLNTSLPVSDITGGVYECCNGRFIEPDGTLYPPAPPGAAKGSAAAWNASAYRAAGVDVYGVLALRQNCSNSGAGPTGCWSAGDTCRAALRRQRDGGQFARDILKVADAYDFAGVHLDWEFGQGCNVSCHAALWSSVAPQLRPAGKRLAISVDDSKGAPFDPANAAWSYETDWKYFLPYADALINMGTYPGGWAKGIAYPAARYVGVSECTTSTPQAPRYCGLKGQVRDMIEQGADPAAQLQLGVWPTACDANGTQTANGWTQPALREFLDYAGERGVGNVVVWTDDAFDVAKEVTTCPWFVAELRRWALGGGGGGGRGA